jgi:hypothetical protein
MDSDKHKPIPLTEKEQEEIDSQNNFEIIEDKEVTKKGRKKK